MKQNVIKGIAALLGVFMVLLLGVGVYSLITPEIELKSAPVAETYSGSWHSVDKDIHLEAEISDLDIQIFWVNDGQSLYWQGSFTNNPPHDSTVIQSVGDTDAMSKSMLASTDAEKYFTYEHKQLTFQLSMLGTTKTIHLIKTI